MTAWLSTMLLAASCLALGCGPGLSGPASTLDGSQLSADAASQDAQALDRPLDAALPPRDAGAFDSSFWSEDAGVDYQSYLPCLSGASITLASCYLDARDRAIALGPLGMSFARASGSFDENGAVPDDRAGLIYQFCQGGPDLFDCLSIEYWWSGVTAQISALRLHRNLEGPPRTRDLTHPPDSPAIIAAFLAAPSCELGAAGYANINVFQEDGVDRIQVVASGDALLLSDPDLGVVQDLCNP